MSDQVEKWLKIHKISGFKEFLRPQGTFKYSFCNYSKNDVNNLNQWYALKPEQQGFQANFLNNKFKF